MSRRSGWFAAAVAFVLGIGCSTEVDLSDRPLFDNGVHVFQAQVLNGNTGGLVTDAYVAIRVGQHVLEAINDGGFYAIYGIPPGTFQINAVAPGLGEFHAAETFNGGGSLSRGDDLRYHDFRNLVMYPEGTAPADLVVSVYDGRDGAAVAGATVVASLTSVAAKVPITDVLANNVGILPPTSAATTDSSGKATLPAGALILGGVYSIDVFGALDAEGVYLVPVNDRSLTVGEQVQEIVVFLSRPSLSPVALMANNEDGMVHDELVVTFPYAIELCSDPADHIWSNTTDARSPWTEDTDGDLATTTPAADDPVITTLSANDTVITLGYVTENNDAGDELYVTFGSVRVKPVGSSDTGCTLLSSVNLRSAGSVSTEIHVREIL